MKKLILLFYTFIHLIALNAQGQGISKIKSYYNSINKSEIIENSWGVERLKSDGIDTLIDFYRDSSLIILTPKFDKKTITDYSFEKDICDFLSIDTLATELVYFNAQKNVIATLGKGVGTTRYLYPSPGFVSNAIKRTIQFLSEIQQLKPDIIFYPTEYFKDYKLNHYNENYLLLFGDKIYVYRTYYKDLIELNEFTRKRYKRAKKLIKKVELSGYACARQILEDIEAEIRGKPLVEDFMLNADCTEQNGTWIGETPDDVVKFFKRFGIDSEYIDNSSVFDSTILERISKSGQHIIYKYEPQNLNMSHMTSIKQILYYQNYIKVYCRGETYVVKIKEILPHQMFFLVK
ncbi:hypothetical protein HW49_09915 [Porphyromonadaceae bacterium COT-184 OH4590]|nr:hypothetical protein HW49_09915 [Porphyromonadaceae bacterium COT-184 OH4590]